MRIFVLDWWNFGAPDKMKLGTAMSLLRLLISKITSRSGASALFTSEEVRGMPDERQPRTDFVEKGGVAGGLKT